MLERATPWDVRRPSEPTTEEMRAIRSRWGTGPEKYQADADALICGIIHARERADDAEKKLAALVEAFDAVDKAGAEVSRLHRAWTASWNNRTREVPVDDSIADAATKAREAQRVAGEKFGAALRAARGEP